MKKRAFAIYLLVFLFLSGCTAPVPTSPAQTLSIPPTSPLPQPTTAESSDQATTEPSPSTPPATLPHLAQLPQRHPEGLAKGIQLSEYAAFLPADQLIVELFWQETGELFVTTQVQGKGQFLLYQVDFAQSKLLEIPNSNVIPAPLKNQMRILPVGDLSGNEASYPVRVGYQFHPVYQTLLAAGKEDLMDQMVFNSDGTLGAYSRYTQVEEEEPREYFYTMLNEIVLYDLETDTETVLFSELLDSADDSSLHIVPALFLHDNSKVVYQGYPAFGMGDVPASYGTIDLTTGEKRDYTQTENSLLDCDDLVAEIPQMDHQLLLSNYSWPPSFPSAQRNIDLLNLDTAEQTSLQLAEKLYTLLGLALPDLLHNRFPASPHPTVDKHQPALVHKLPHNQQFTEEQDRQASLLLYYLDTGQLIPIYTMARSIPYHPGQMYLSPDRGQLVFCNFLPDGSYHFFVYQLPQ